MHQEEFLPRGAAGLVGQVNECQEPVCEMHTHGGIPNVMPLLIGNVREVITVRLELNQALKDQQVRSDWGYVTLGFGGTKEPSMLGEEGVLRRGSREGETGQLEIALGVGS